MAALAAGIAVSIDQIILPDGARVRRNVAPAYQLSPGLRADLRLAGRLSPSGCVNTNNDEIMTAWVDRSLVIGVRVDPRGETNCLRIDSDIIDAVSRSTQKDNHQRPSDLNPAGASVLGLASRDCGRVRNDS
jgi:hypothetical protein